MNKYSNNKKQSVEKTPFFKRTHLSGLVVLALMASTAQAGKITSGLSATGADGFGGWNTGNVDVIVNGTGSTYDPVDGSYIFAEDTDNTYVGNVKDGAGNTTGIALAKDWPVGEPPGIKVINDDLLVKAPKPPNCIMSTSYLADHFLDSADPQQVYCSGPFQSHKRYKLAMLPGSETTGIDLVYNVEAEQGSRNYQIFQKINNWTDGRLEGFKVEIGTGIGASFKTASESGIALANLNISIPEEIWPVATSEVAVFSSGLFGPLDKHTGSVGFYDPEQRAGFLVNEHGQAALTDTLTADTTLGSDYNEVPAGATNQFGPWVASNMLPYGVFFDDDGNPETDAALLAWYGLNPETGVLGWMGGSQDTDGPFSEIPAAEIGVMSENLAYTMGEIDDLVNVGLDYIITIGDVTTFNSSTITIRVTPTPDTSGAPVPPYVGHHPVPELTFTSSDAAVLLDPNPEFVVDGLLTARVGDADLNNDPLLLEEVEVAIATSTGLSGTLTLIEQGENRGVFVAILPEEFSAVPVGTVVTMTYVDAENGSGESEVKTSSSTAEEDVPVLTSDVRIDEVEFPESVTDREREGIHVKLDNAGPDAATGSVLITGSDGSEFSGEFTDLAAGEEAEFEFDWTANLDDHRVAETVNWSVTVTVDGQIVDEASASTLVKPRSKKGKKG